MGVLCVAYSYADLKAKQWEVCPKCGSQNPEFFLQIKAEDFVKVESDG